MIDPSLIPTCARERKFLQLADSRGLNIQRVAGSRTAVRLTGPGVFVVAAELRLLTEADFQLPRIRPDAPSL